MNTHRSVRQIAAFVLCATVGLAARAEAQTLLSLADGDVQGTTDGTVRQFLGIPLPRRRWARCAGVPPNRLRRGWER